MRLTGFTLALVLSLFTFPVQADGTSEAARLNEVEELAKKFHSDFSKEAGNTRPGKQFASLIEAYMAKRGCVVARTELDAFLKNLDRGPKGKLMVTAEATSEEIETFLAVAQERFARNLMMSSVLSGLLERKVLEVFGSGNNLVRSHGKGCA